MELPMGCMSHRIKSYYSLELAPKRHKENLAVVPFDSIGDIREST